MHAYFFQNSTSRVLRHYLRRRCVRSASSASSFDWEDALNLEHNLTDDERQLKASFRDFCQKALMPRIMKSNRDGVYEKDVLKDMASMGALGCTIGAYGCTKVSQVGYGLIAREVERVDSAYRLDGFHLHVGGECPWGNSWTFKKMIFISFDCNHFVFE